MSVVSFSFRGADVRTVTLANGEPGFVGKDVCDRLGYANPSDAMSRHCKGVGIRYPLQTAGGVQQVRILTEPDVLRLIVSSTLPEAVEFERWVFEEVLPSLRKTGAYAMPAAVAQAPAYAVPKSVEAMQFADALATMLRIDGAARLGMARKVAERAAPELLDLVPTYAIDAPKGSGADMGSRPVSSLTTLLMIHGGGMSAMQANRRLEKLGYLEQHFRKARGNGMKTYWSITDVGLKYGKNATHERNQHETFPLWYDHTAQDLIQQIKGAV